MYCSRFITVILFLFVFGFRPDGSAESSENPDPEWRPSPTGAALRSLAFPGWGQVYARQPLKAVIYGGIEQGFIYSIYHRHKLYNYYSMRGNEDLAEFYRNDRNRMGWYLAAAIILSVMDAFVDAHLYGFDISEKLSSSGGKTGFLGSGVNLVISWRTP